MLPLLAFLLAAGGVGLGILLGRNAAPGGAAELTDARSEAAEARGMVADLRETIWEHRDSAPLLADVLLDDIRRFEQTGRRPDPPLE